MAACLGPGFAAPGSAAKTRRCAGAAPDRTAGRQQRSAGQCHRAEPRRPDQSATTDAPSGRRCRPAVVMQRCGSLCPPLEAQAAHLPDHLRGLRAHLRPACRRDGIIIVPRRGDPGRGRVIVSRASAPSLHRSVPASARPPTRHSGRRGTGKRLGTRRVQAHLAAARASHRSATEPRLRWIRTGARPGGAEGKPWRMAVARIRSCAATAPISLVSPHSAMPGRRRNRLVHRPLPAAPSAPPQNARPSVRSVLNLAGTE